MLKKGAIAVNTTVYLVLGIIFMAIMGYILIKLPLFLEKLCDVVPVFCDDDNDNGDPGHTYTDDFSNAVMCSHYRCFKDRGCNDPKMETIEWNSDGKTVNCKEDFCDKDWQDKDGKICDYSSMQHPVEIYMSDDIQIEADSSDFREFDCILDKDSSFKGGTSSSKSLLYIVDPFSEFSDYHGRISECDKFKKIRTVPAKLNLEKNNALYIWSWNMGDSFNNYIYDKIPTFSNYIEADSFPNELQTTSVQNKNEYSILEMGEKEKISLIYRKNHENPAQRIVTVSSGSSSRDWTKIDEVYLKVSEFQKDPITETSDIILEMKCGSQGFERKVLCPGENLFCGAYKIKLNSISKESINIISYFKVEVEVEYVEPNCYERGTSDCYPGCWLCSENVRPHSEPILIPTMCCFTNTECDNEDGICEGFTGSEPEPDCHTSEPTSCPNNCDYCKMGTIPVMCCEKGETCDSTTGLCEGFSRITEDLEFDFTYGIPNLDKVISITRAKYPDNEPLEKIHIIKMNIVREDPEKPLDFSRELLNFSIIHNGKLFHPVDLKKGVHYKLTDNLEIVLKDFLISADLFKVDDVKLSVNYLGECTRQCSNSVFDIQTGCCFVESFDGDYNAGHSC